uniref:Uncharacterized protein n=1 Tax=Anguilla anguilla TaxID=7936 RepID=A0A0E9TRE4_ANGAN
MVSKVHLQFSDVTFLLQKSEIIFII